MTVRSACSTIVGRESSWGQMFIHILCSSRLFGNIKSCFLSLCGAPPIRLWRYGVFCAPGHSQLWTGSALMVHEMDVVAFLLLHQDPSAGGADQPVLCRHGRSRDSKWASFQVRMYLFLKVGFYYSKAVISICLVYYTPLLKYLARHSFCLLTGVFTL